MEIHLVGVATKRNNFLEDWEQSARRAGFTRAKVLCEGEEWEGFQTSTSQIPSGNVSSTTEKHSLPNSPGNLKPTTF